MMNPLKWLASLFGRGNEPQGPLRFDVAATSDRGLVRPENEDSYLMRKEEFFLAVADGMGGGADGALASSWVCEALKGLLATPSEGFRERVKGTGAALEAANARVREYMKERGIKMMGSTAAVHSAYARPHGWRRAWPRACKCGGRGGAEEPEEPALAHSYAGRRHWVQGTRRMAEDRHPRRRPIPALHGRRTRRAE